MCEPCNYTPKPTPSLQTTNSVCQKRKLATYLDSDSANLTAAVENKPKIFKAIHNPTFTEITPAWELDLPLGFGEFPNFGDRLTTEVGDVKCQSSCDSNIAELDNDLGLKKCGQHSDIKTLENETELQILERERFPGFTFLPLEEQLDHIADSLWFKFPHVDTVKLLKLFTLANHDRQDIWNTPVCGNPILLNRIINRLRQSQNLPKSPNISEFQAEGFHLLGLLSRSVAGRDGISSLGGFRLIIDQIKDTLHNENVFRYCCYALGNLVTSMVDDVEGSFKQVIENEHVIEMMLNMLKLKFDNWHLVQQICFAIGNVAFIGDFEPIVIQQGGIELVLAAMRKHEKMPNVMTDAIFFLKNFAFGEMGRATIIAKDGIPLILETMGNNENHEELLELALNLLFDLSFSGAVDIIMQNPKGIQLVLKAMEMHQNNIPLLREALRALLRIYSICNCEQKKMVIKAGAVQTLRKTLNNNKNNNTNNNNTQQTTLVKQIFNGFALFSLEKITHEMKPDAFPSLAEISARKVIDHSVKFCGDFIPQELDQFLKEKKKDCSLCGKAYFDFYYEAISFSKIPEIRSSLPIFWKLCSARCFDEVTINRS